jgi:ADP-ribosylglycohydrolase
MDTTDNLDLVARLAGDGTLRVACDPGCLPAPRPASIPWERAAGMLLGLAIGDSFGGGSEGKTPAERRALHGEIRDYLPKRWAEGRRVGLPSDDTQLAFRTVQHLLQDGRLDPERLAERLASGRIFGLGATVRSFLSARKRGGGWIKAAQESAGNGALMRIAPVLLPHLRAPTAAIWADAALAGAVTHNDFASNASCVAFVACLWEAMIARAPVPRGFWLDRFVDVARRVEGDEPRYTPRAPRHGDRRTTLWGFTQEVVRRALERDAPAAEACDEWHSGAFLLETVPSVLYVLERHGNDAEETLVRAVNDTRDNDTCGAIVGAAVGALHGVDALPRRLRDGLLGRLGENDDGSVQRLVDEARQAWGPT